VAFAAPFAVVFILLGPQVLKILSRNSLHAGPILFFWLALVALIQATWNAFAQFLFAINKQQKFAYYYLLLALLTAAAPIFVGRIDTVTRSAVLWCVAESIMLVIVWRGWWTESDLDISFLAAESRRMLATGRSVIRQLLSRTAQ
jgi:O-antigen/teichoic acid export membrane protein